MWLFHYSECGYSNSQNVAIPVVRMLLFKWSECNVYDHENALFLALHLVLKVIAVDCIKILWKRLKAS